MSVATVSTRRITGLDYRVWLAMAMCWVVCAGVFGYKKIKGEVNAQPCGAFRILLNGDAADGPALCDPDLPALFQIKAPPGTVVEWNFNDGSGTVKDSRAVHKFAAEGDYNVVATVNGRCDYARQVTVKRPVQSEPVVPAVKIFSDSSKVTAGARLRFTAVANVPVSAYEWTLLPTGETQTGRDITFSFPHAGEFTVRVVVNNNPAVGGEQKITVTEVPQSPLPLPSPLPGGPPVVPPGPWNNPGNPPGTKTPAADTGIAKPVPPPDNIHETDPETFKGLLQGVLKEGKKVNELYQYLKYEGSTQVEVNGKKPFMTLDDFCINKHNKKIKSLALVRQKDNPKYIQVIKVELKGLWPFN